MPYIVPGTSITPGGPSVSDADLAAHAADTSTHGIRNTEMLRTESSAQAPRLVSLMSGQSDDSWILSNSTQSTDTVNYKVGGSGAKLTMAGAVTATAIIDPVGPTDPLTMPPASVVGLWVYVTDASKITSLTVEVYTDSGLTGSAKWARTASGLVNGWNLQRWTAFSGVSSLDTWGDVYRVRAVVVTNAATDITIGHMWAECPPKAQVLFCADRGYRSFVDNGLPDLRSLDVPVTWALDPALLGTSVGTADEVITEADVATFAAAGDSISLHGWDGSATSAMTSTQIEQDTVKALRWLQQRGYAGRMWRAGWVQNLATNAAAARPHVLAYGTPTSQAANSAWPPVNRWDIPRYSVHGRTTGQIDTEFNILERTHSLLVCYTHGISAAGGNDSTPDEWNYFVSKLTEGIEGGWLECVTFEDLYARSGGKFRSVFGDNQYDYLDETGTATRKSML